MVFDIETVPDIDLGRRLYGLEGVADEEVAKAMGFRRLQETGSEFLPLHQHRIVAIAAVWRHRDAFRVTSLGEPGSSEADLIGRFFRAIDEHSPELVSWNGGGFDLPVLHYRSLLHGIEAPRYWETGGEDSSFRYNNYLSRFHWRHLDLMDVLSGWQNRARAPLQEIAVMLGFPGKLGMAGDQVWATWLRDGVVPIRNYCETDALNTYLVYLRFQVIRGLLGSDGLRAEIDRVRAFLDGADAQHWQEFRDAWPQEAGAGAGA
jgi:hypothetical protein